MGITWGKYMIARSLTLMFALLFLGACAGSNSDSNDTASQEPKVRHFTSKSIAGVSMGGGAAADGAAAGPARAAAHVPRPAGPRGPRARVGAAAVDTLQEGGGAYADRDLSSAARAELERSIPCSIK